MKEELNEKSPKEKAVSYGQGFIEYSGAWTMADSNLYKAGVEVGRHHQSTVQ